MREGAEPEAELLTVLYGTQSGCAEHLAFTLTSLALKRGFQYCRCLPADEFSLESWKDSSPLVIICSNASQGEAPDSIRVSWARLLEPAAPSMEGLRFAVFGAGDSLYQKFNYMAKMLHNRLKQLGGEPIVNRGLGDESDAKGHDEAFFPWIVQLWRALGRPTLDEHGELTEDLLKVPLLTRYNVSLAEVSVETDALSQKALHNQETFNCVVKQNVRLTPKGYFQAIHHVVFSREVTRFEGDVARRGPLSFEVGDALGIYCANSESMIDAFLAQTQQSGEVMVCVTPNTSEGLLQQRHQMFFGRSMRLRTFLKHYVDLEAVAGRPFLACWPALRERRRCGSGCLSWPHRTTWMTSCRIRIERSEMLWRC
ncbi:NADPH-dependent FMN/FAD containing oxidoreductase [Trypanosoma conorhini]|uniref:NADPH-dependent FMN/FAD containing oxidoreductase n=1 Tax=Trypanosoma conorhini TaxID=83891 RepID=A0A422PJH0_9TRYP|nr:NADPH-dependent FMN/FAD containing oxidoreductase [Trypanosoma conorhini]RNF17853.1 NADPH-dependent FMN/FAD containing oxidoreductase [Trypanosoma conorhini]